MAGTDAPCQACVFISGNHGWMHITFSANRLGIAEAQSNRFDCLSNVSFRTGCRKALGKCTKRLSRQDRARPSAKVLCGEVLTGDFAQVAVDVLAADRTAMP